MGEAVWFITRSVGGNAGLDAVLRLAVGALVGVIVYFGLLAVMGAPELDALKRRLLPQNGPQPESAN
jgi:putative peptidoglycan lipid II flippase